MQEKHESQEFNLDDILSEFHDLPQDDSALDALPDDLDALLGSLEDIVPEAAAEDISEEIPAVSEPETAQITPEPEVVSDTEEVPIEDTIRMDDLHSHSESRKPEEPEVTDDVTIRMEALLEETDTASEPEAEPEFIAPPEKPRIVYNPRIRLRELKKKLVAGPEKRYYELSEAGTVGLQIAIGLNLVIVALCILTTTLYALDIFPENRLRFVVFSQILAMLVSALLGCHQMLDGLGDLFRGRFTINTMLSITFAACCADAVFCLSELRIPCCAAFSLEITMALWARYQRHMTEMEQMDTLRKAVRLHALVKVPDYYDGRAGILRREGELEDFMDHYAAPSGPEKLQGIYCLIGFLLSIAIAVFAYLNHGISLAIQIFSTSLLVAVPASFFIALTRPAALLERRLHMVGSVLCGWQGVKKLCGKFAFPLADEDLFPAGTTKLNGVKFYGDRTSDEVVSWATSLICAAGGSLEPVFRQLLDSRDGKVLPVTNFQSYGNGGIGGEIRDESVLLGTMEFLEDLGVEIPEGTMVNQAVYCAIDGQLSAVFAISYAKMRSCAAGIISLSSSRKVKPVLIGSDFMLTASLLRAKFKVNTRRIAFPSREERDILTGIQPSEDAPTLAIATREDLASYAYAVSGARALRSAFNLGMVIHLIGGITGLLIMAALAYLGTTELLTPTHILLYQLVWMVPGLLITEWTRTV